MQQIRYIQITQPSYSFTSVPNIKYLSEERKLIKCMKESFQSRQSPQIKILEERFCSSSSNIPQKSHSRTSTHFHLNGAVESLEFQWESLKKQHNNFDQRSSSGSPSKFNIVNTLKPKQQNNCKTEIHNQGNSFTGGLIDNLDLKQSQFNKQQILRNVVPHSKINLAQVINNTDQSVQYSYESPIDPHKSYQNDLKESQHFKTLVDKYSNIYRKKTPDSNKHQSSNTTEMGSSNIYNNKSNELVSKMPKRECYNRNNLKVLDEKVRSASREISPSKCISTQQERAFNNIPLNSRGVFSITEDVSNQVSMHSRTNTIFKPHIDHYNIKQVRNEGIEQKQTYNNNKKLITQKQFLQRIQSKGNHNPQQSIENYNPTDQKKNLTHLALFSKRK